MVLQNRKISHRRLRTGRHRNHPSQRLCHWGARLRYALRPGLLSESNRLWSREIQRREHWLNSSIHLPAIRCGSQKLHRNEACITVSQAVPFTLGSQRPICSHRKDSGTATILQGLRRPQCQRPHHWNKTTIAVKHKMLMLYRYINQVSRFRVALEYVTMTGRGGA